MPVLPSFFWVPGEPVTITHSYTFYLHTEGVAGSNPAARTIPQQAKVNLAHSLVRFIIREHRLFPNLIRDFHPFNTVVFGNDGMLKARAKGDARFVRAETATTH